MKINFLLILIILFQINLFGQEYVPFNFDDGIWVCNAGIYGGEPHDFVGQYYTDGDTIINGISYHKLIYYFKEIIYWEEPDIVHFFGYIGAIRNTDNKQVEFVSNYRDYTEIIYDFNLSVNDTIKVGYGAENYLPEKLIVISIDSVEYCGRYHKRYNLNDSSIIIQRLIEGIGFTSGLINPIFFQFEAESSLVCYTEKYNNECEECSLLVSNTELEQNSNINIFPNPSSGVLKIKSDKTISEYRIINETGQMIISNNKLNEKDFRLNLNLPNGIYFLTIITKDKTKYSRKIIIQK